jgi:Flp pilus assembly protein TadD
VDLGRIAADVEARGDAATALSLYQQAVTASGEEPAAHVQLGDAWLRAGRIQAAIGAYRAALAKSPNDGTALLGLGTALVRSGEVEQGLDALRRAAPLVKTAAAYNRLGVAQTLTGQLEGAQASFAAACSQAPDDLDIRANLALAQALAGESDTAVSVMADVAASPQAEPRHRRLFVTVLGLSGRGSEARSAAGELPAREIQALLERAGAIRAMPDARARAKALGVAMG